MRKFVMAGVTTVFSWVLLAPVALAQGDGERVGECWRKLEMVTWRSG